MARNYEMDMTEGPLFKKLVRFSVPVVLMGMLQFFYNAADMIVAGRYAGKEALAAVGSTGSLINLIVALFFGLSVGVSVTVANHYGARAYDKVSNAVHTALTTSLIGGVAFGALGFFLSRQLLVLMDSPPDVIDQAALYVRIYFVGLPMLSIYNFGASVLRAVGDTRRPLYFLIVSGLLNVILNLVFVIYFHMGVAGVAWATVISETVSAALVVWCLTRSTGCYRFFPSRMRINAEDIKSMAKIGLPAGMQTTVFAISNVLIQSSVNSFGSLVMAGNSAAGNLENFIYISMNSVSQSSLSFTSQNVGAKKFGRIKKVSVYCNILVLIVAAITGALVIFFREELLGLYNSDPEVISYGSTRLLLFGTTYALCGIMEVYTGSLRGMGRSVAPMVLTMLGACGLRIAWIATVFKYFGTMMSLYISYPVSWAITASALYICYRITQRRLSRESGLTSSEPAPGSAS